MDRYLEIHAAESSDASGGAAEPALTPQTKVDPRLLVAGKRRGWFVTFEGIEGSGKTTQITRLFDRLQSAEEPVLLTREPGGSPIGHRLRTLLLGTEGAGLTSLAKLLLYVGDRAQHLHEIVDPALAAGTHVLCDRYLDATLAYQGFARGLDLDYIRALHTKPPLDRRPDRTILLDLDPELGLTRARTRNDDLGLARSEGRFEREALAFHRRVRDGYLSLAEADPFRVRIVAAEGHPDEIEARVADLLSDLFPVLDVEDES